MENKNADLTSLKINRSSPSSSNGYSGKKSLVIWGFGILSASFLIYFLWDYVFASTIDVSVVTASKVSSSQSNAVLTASGYIVAQRKAAVASKGTGRLQFLGVVEGDAVKKNQIIARLDDNDIRAQLEQAKANLKLSEADLNDAENSFKRTKKLFASGSAAQSELDAAESRFNRTTASIELAKAQVLGAEVAMENMLIRAPFDGTVLTKNADVGEIVAPFAASASSKAAVVTMADMSSLQVEADVSESNIERIKPNQDCEISLEAYPDFRYPGFVAKIVPTADRAKATVMVKVGFKNYDKKVLPEMRAKVLFLNEPVSEEMLNKKPKLVIPASTLVQNENEYFVYKVTNEKAEQAKVTIGEKLGAYVEILSGLVDGEKVIDNPSKEIKDGTKVNVKK
ncbi:MAG: efflux RND transporter periplasmic adaptor subunit [Ignavibacteriaceae bacterium]|jgi:RND family efflux transporter MFP subunit|nr:efflux RND transporter periplasmic adaptor subunit [Ignavibacteriaceae bacterium]